MMRYPRHTLRGAANGPSAMTALLIGLSLCAALLALWTVYREYQTRMVELRLEDQTTLLASGSAGPPSIPPPPPAAPTTRLLLADALYVAREAAREPDGQLREAQLMRAHDELGAAMQIRPHWAEGWVTAAYIASLHRPPDPDLERRALLRSYTDAPYLEKAGYWRIEASLQQWDQLPPAMRRKLVNEAAWLLRHGPVENRRALFDLARNSPAYRPIFLRWREIQ